MIDKMLDKIEVMLLKLKKDDPFKEALESEYSLYRTILEGLPRDASVPNKLFSSVFSLDQRLNHYIMLGKSSNPLVDLIPSLSKRITSEEDKDELFVLVYLNASYIDSRKTELEVLKSLLKKVDYSGKSTDILATISLVERDYLSLNVYSNELEKAISAAKYQYMLRLIYENQLDSAKEFAQDFSYDMVWIIYNKHKESVLKLLEKNRPALAKSLSDFLTYLPKDKEKDLDFWIVLAQIEDDNFTPMTDGPLEVQEKELIKVDKSEKKHRFSFSSLFDKASYPKVVLKLPSYSFEIKEDSVEIMIGVSQDLTYNDKSFNRMYDKLYSRNKESFESVSLIIKVIDYIGNNSNYTSIRNVVSRIASDSTIKSIELWGGNKDIVPRTFLSDCHFEKIFFAKGEWTLPADAFGRCLSLEEVIFSKESQLTLGDYAFCECRSLKTVILPDNMDNYSYGVGTFQNCESLEFINWPERATTVKKKTFYNCKNLKSLGVRKIDEICEDAFHGCSSFNSPDSFDAWLIGDDAFNGCTSLTDFSFNNTIHIGSQAFAFSGLTKASIVSSNTQIDEGAFMGSKIRSFSMPHGTLLPNKVCKECEDLVDVEIGSNLSILGKQAFYGCISLKQFPTASCNCSIGERCFEKCTSLKEVGISSTAKAIGKYAFANCTDLVEFKYPSIDTIEDDVFNNCSSLESITFSIPIIKIGYRAFNNCSRLRSFDFQYGLRSIGNAAFSGTSLTSVILPDSVVKIGDEAFTNCLCIEKVRISAKVQTIPYKLFYGCYNLKTIDMSDCNIKQIARSAFAACDMLSTIHFGKTLRNIEKDIFSKDFAIKTIIISKELYSFLKTTTSPGETVLLSKIGLSDIFLISSIKETNVVTFTLARIANMLKTH